MKKILITGCNGQLGRAIRKEYAKEQVEFINTDVTDSDTSVALNITNLDEVLKLAENHKPDVIMNCAAHTGVDACQEQWDSAYRINALGARNMAIASAKVGAKLVHVSTDYVFSGDSKKPYTEFDATGPTGAYGKTKLEGERFVQQFGERYFMIRTAWLYGTGKNFVETMLHLAESRKEVTVVDDQWGSPTSAAELARLIHHLEPTENYGLFHGTCEGSCCWAEFAEEIFRLAGKNTFVKHVTTEEYGKICPATAPRPAYSVLDNYMLRLTSGYKMADWKDALTEYMESGRN